MNADTRYGVVRSQTYEGHCTVCGQWSVFVDVSRPIRETYQCGNCRASMRERITAEAILAAYGNARHSSIKSLADDSGFNDLRIFEPGVSGPFRKVFSNLPSYQNSFFWEGLSPGEYRQNTRHEDLMALSFGDACFDLVLSCDILEHVRRPWVAFKEIRRVLRKGGCHVFSIPSLVPMASQTLRRVDTSTDKDIHLKPPHYHGDGRGGKSLVYTEFGADMFEALQRCGFQTVSIRGDHTDAERTRVNAFVSYAI